MNSPLRWQIRRIPADDFWNRRATKSDKTFGGPFSRSTALEMTGYGVFPPAPLSPPTSTELSLHTWLFPFNSSTSGRIHNRSNEYVNPSAPVLIRTEKREALTSRVLPGWRLLQRGRSWRKDQVRSSERSNRSRGWRSQPGKSAFEKRIYPRLARGGGRGGPRPLPIDCDC